MEIYRSKNESLAVEQDIYSPVYVSETTHWNRRGKEYRNIHLTLNVDETGIYDSILGPVAVDLTELGENQATIRVSSEVLQGVRRGVNKKQPEIIPVHISQNTGHGARDLNPKVRLSVYYPAIRNYR